MMEISEAVGSTAICRLTSEPVQNAPIPHLDAPDIPHHPSVEETPPSLGATGATRTVLPVAKFVAPLWG